MMKCISKMEDIHSSCNLNLRKAVFDQEDILVSRQYGSQHFQYCFYIPTDELIDEILKVKLKTLKHPLLDY